MQLERVYVNNFSKIFHDFELNLLDIYYEYQKHDESQDFIKEVDYLFLDLQQI